LLESSSKKVLIAIPKRLPAPLEVKSFSGVTVKVESAFADNPVIKEFAPDLVISNNDFSDAAEEWGQQNIWPLNPPRELGWYQRKKSNYFKHYNQLVSEFSEVCSVPSSYLNVKTELFSEFDMTDAEAMQRLATQVDQMVGVIKTDYAKQGIESEPTVFIKNNAGTYGLGVVRVTSGQDVLSWTYNSRKKMKAAKGGRQVEEVILQEGVPTRVRAEGSVAEPVVYMIGQELAGGFLRAHDEKSETESLNSPGAAYKKLCFADLETNLDGSPLENVYGWSAKLGVLAIGLEAKELGVEFKAYRRV
jgi:glutamate--cysteine ligase